MNSSQLQLPQWSELGDLLSGPDGDEKRMEILARLEVLESQANSFLRSFDCADSARLEALVRAIGHARDIATRVFKPVDLSAL